MFKTKFIHLEDSGSDCHTAPLLDSGADNCAFYLADSVYNRFYRFARESGSIFALAPTRNATGKTEQTLHILGTARNPLLVEIQGLRNPIPVHRISLMKAATYSYSKQTLLAESKPQTLIGRGKYNTQTLLSFYV